MKKTFIIAWIILAFVATSYSAQVLLDLDDGDTVNGDTFDTIDDNFTELYGFTDGTTPLTNATGLPLTTGVTGFLPEANGGLGADFSVGATQIIATSGGGTYVGIGTPASLESYGGLGTFFSDYADSDDADEMRTALGIGETGTDPDVTETGERSHDTDGAIKSLDDSDGSPVTVTTDAIARMYHSAGQWAAAQRLKILVIPFDTAGAVTNYQPWPNLSGMTFTWEYAYFRSDTDDLVITVDEFTGIGNLTNLNEVVTCTVATDGTDVYWELMEATDVVGVTDTEIEHGHGLSFDIGAAAEGFVAFIGYEDSNVD